MALDRNSTNGTRVWKTQTGESVKLLRRSSEPSSFIVWDNKDPARGWMPDENTIRIFSENTYNDFTRISPSSKGFLSDIKNGDLFDDPHWGGVCSARWFDNDLFMTRDFNGQVVWRTFNGDGIRLVKNGTILILGDDSVFHTAYMPDPDTVRVWFWSMTYDFTRYTPSAPKAVVRPGDTFEYSAWEGECTVMWVDSEIWMARDTNSTNNYKVWKTENGESRALIQISNIPTVTLLWDNREYHKAYMPDANTISVLHGDVPYNFKRTSKTHEGLASIDNGDIFGYSAWGGPCTATWVNGEVWIARDLTQTTGVRVLKTVEGAGSRLIRGGVVRILWDNVEYGVAFMLNKDTIRVWLNNIIRDFIREPPSNLRRNLR